MHTIRRPIAPTPSKGPLPGIPGRYTVHGVPAATDNVVWVIEDLQTGDAAIVDGPDAQGALELIARRHLRLTAVLLTHGHGDHIGVVDDLYAKGLLDGVRVVGSRASVLQLPHVTDWVKDGDVAPFGDARVIRTDGHVTGHVSYLLSNLAFVGDTLFAGGCGYLFDGPPAAMWASLQRLCALPEDTVVFCAHEYTEDNLAFAVTVEPRNEALAARQRDVLARRARGETTLPTTVGLERATNPFVRAPDATTFAERRAAKDSKRYKQRPAL